ncbi:hypothetical protein [Bacillus cereus group sp. BY6-1LC]|uniref:hypothetical protein n=1 Tax=Bacillus cereus group sp. BY6-1LC TaxID=3018077 RepID=UPI0022E597E2|nr:hypothetical protein [Bacillus cereus group sp. BY6-1LC]MDA1802799.1 hypothetical protein [Bacillus cereus group sp. BY6-1LC]
MEINNVQFTQIKAGEYEILFPAKMQHIKIQNWTHEGNKGSKMEQFGFECKTILERKTVHENPCFEEIDLAMIVTFLHGKVYVDQPYQIFETKQEERKFAEFLIHREDILEAAKKHEFLYEQLKEKPRVDGFVGSVEELDEKQGKKIEINTFIEYEEEGSG